jgi:hypothetical protein
MKTAGPSRSSQALLAASGNVVMSTPSSQGAKIEIRAARFPYHDEFITLSNTYVQSNATPQREEPLFGEPLRK